MQIPKADLDNGGNHTIGVWAATDRRAAAVIEHRRKAASAKDDTQGWVQVSRLGNPLINEVVIPTNLKDKWNASAPANDKQFETYYANPILATVLQKLYPQFGPFQDTNRQDLVQLLGTGLKSPMLNYTGPTFADELRLNLSIPPTPFDKINRLGVLGGDLAGYPNGRRLEDDVVDISERAVGGVLIGHSLPLGDGVDANDVAEPARLPVRADAVQRLRQHEGRHLPHHAVSDATRFSSQGWRRLRPPPSSPSAECSTAVRLSASAGDVLPTAVAAELQKGFAAGDTAGGDRRPAGRAAGESAQRQGARHARPRLRAACPRDGRRDVLRQGGRNPARVAVARAAAT